MSALKTIIDWLFRGSPEYKAAQAKQAAQKAKASLALDRKRSERAARTLSELHSATCGTFIVADIETTGLSARAEIIEIAALRANPRNGALEEFTTLIRPTRAVPREIIELTGITPKMLTQKGVSLQEAMTAFVSFCEGHPVVFHNAPFDRRFIQAAATSLGLYFDNPVLCSLKAARAAWPELTSHKLITLAQYLDISTPTHRGLDDVRATLEVILAARSMARPVHAAQLSA